MEAAAIPAGEAMRKVLDRFLEVEGARRPRLERFYAKAEPGYLIIQRTPAPLFGPCNTVADIVANNLRALEPWVAAEGTDEIPFLEPWIGTGVYANIFGCPYVWRDDQAPCVHYRYHRIQETVGLAPPDWRRAPVANMVLDTIDALREATGDVVPICATDTQSAFDTATLILDASEFFVSCYEEPVLVERFMHLITESVIDFTQAQFARIGRGRVARPGHIMPSFGGGPGLSVSDDNLAVSSPLINERVSFPSNKRLAEAFGGLAIHSCGCWQETMARLDGASGVFMVDCALTRSWDPNPNDPARVREALSGKNIILKARVGSDPDEIDSILSAVADPNSRIIVEMGWQGDQAAAAYDRVRKRLDRVYG